jgi:hypothetical protein
VTVLAESPQHQPVSRVRRLFDRLRLLFNQSLDDSQVFRRRADDDPGTFRASGSGVNFPLGIFLYLIAQLIGGIWWAATMQAKVDSLVSDNARLWQKIEAQEMVQNKLENGLDERIRGKVRETLSDWNYVHIPRKGE